MVAELRNFLKTPQWRRQHRWRRAVWQALNTTGLTGLHPLPTHRRWLDVRRLDMPLPGLPADAAGRRVVQLSDVHHSPVVSRRYLREMLGHVARLRPDVLVVTGDLVTGGYRFDEPVAELLAEVGAGATLCTLGNHDYGVRGKGAEGERRAASLRRAVEANGLTLLRNEAAVVGGITFVGLDDLWSGRLDADAAFAGVAGPTICLNHDPKNARALLDHPWQWMLAGHTHGRQLATSTIGRTFNKKRRRPFVAGHYRLAEGKDLYVNRGLSYGQRRHHWCRPEVTVFRLVAA